MLNEIDLLKWVEQQESAVRGAMHRVEKVALHNQRRVLEAFSAERVSASDFAGSNGYGIGDAGRDKLERIYARLFGTEGALVRTQLVSGTHALAAVLFAACRPGDHVLFATGMPYDTLQSVAGISDTLGSAKEWGIQVDVVPLQENGAPDIVATLSRILPSTRLVMCQKSRGYGARRALTNAELAPLFDEIRLHHPDVWIAVDNCYAEFVEAEEVTVHGAHIAAGSLIKNPGGGIVPTGAYIVGPVDFIERVGAEVYAPGISSELGPTHGHLREMFQGLFMAPHVVSQALKVSIMASRVFEQLGYTVSPRYDEPRADLILSIDFEDRQALQTFAREVQATAAVDSFAVPEFASMAGYSDEVLMAAGTFIQGASLELTADAPLRPPFRAYLQGGLTYEHGFWTLFQVARTLDQNIVTSE